MLVGYGYQIWAEQDRDDMREPVCIHGGISHTLSSSHVHILCSSLLVQVI